MLKYNQELGNFNNRRKSNRLTFPKLFFHVSGSYWCGFVAASIFLRNLESEQGHSLFFKLGVELERIIAMVSYSLDCSFIQYCPMFEIFNFKPIIKLSSICLISPCLLLLPPSDSPWVLLISYCLPFLMDSYQECMVDSFSIFHTSLLLHSFILLSRPSRLSAILDLSWQ